MTINLKTISIVISIIIGSITVASSAYNGIAWIVRTSDMLVWLYDYSTGTNNKIIEIDKRVVRLEEKI